MTSSVDASDCEQAAIRAFLAGADDECAKHWESAHRAALAAGHPAESARYAFWLGLVLLLSGRTALGNGWLARTDSLIAEVGTPCRAAGYVLIPQALAALEGGDPHRTLTLGARASETGNRFGDADLRAFGTLCQGQALIALDDADAGVGQLDEVMVAATTGELGPITTGIAYCAAILEYMNLLDLRRASQWTDALGAWCEAQPDLVPFRGQCLVHRSQLQQAGGDWVGALSSAESACRRLADPLHPALGLASYQEGELHRLVGDFGLAERCYRKAGRHGHDPVPGLALLELAKGRDAAAAATIRRALTESGTSGSRAALLFAAVDILRSAGDVTGARELTAELSAIADRSSSDVVGAMAAQAAGSVLLGEGKVTASLPELRAAARSWRAAHMQYETARTAVLLGLACAALGDFTGAKVEFDCARDIFVNLGAAPDLERVNKLAAVGTPEGSVELSAREREVLALLAAGRTNREIAERLVVSPHTVARHVEHIYAKLGVANRSAATAFAYQHHLV
jgi:DNA-binding CsgD family transcriptional regulator